MTTAFVTGSTGLLGNNLVRLLVERGVTVRALARSRAKAKRQFDGLDVEIVEGDMADIRGFSDRLAGCDVLYHTAAFFRDSYKGGSHWDELERTNVQGTTALLQAAYDAGIRRAVHTSSVAVLTGHADRPIDETMLRPEAEADDYYRSKILADRAVLAFLESHLDMTVPLVLPGWMFGPRDLGPTSSGQFVLDYCRRNIPGRTPGGFSVVDARDVALHLIAAAEKGASGERYLAAGDIVSMADLLLLMQEVTGIEAPTRNIPLVVLNLLSYVYEAQHRFTGRPVLLSRATARLLASEPGRIGYDHSKSERVLGVAFRPVRETLADTVAWYRRSGKLPDA
ncbi:SDR family oxidoreductase [Rhizobium halophytocola]|uniref:Dihydroflavonol-4-reductase n=1 Tax=Rhizobium halophytocola TaxID=735519 RepID=A0ABS4E5L0_9HYPH|nr:SDR family oxidoreductase [Rhizobium halophytocola]MBP1853217.1 dihydroflavonol-4-reductase [Rhizobium halophytocola]